eukprot:jgi/Tetstr1/456332/TSEL_004112.t1
MLEDYGGATQWRAVFEDGDIVGLLRSEVVEAMAAAQEHPPVDADGEARLVTVHEGDDLSRSGKVTVQSGWVMEDCLHHMETFSILNAGPLLEKARNVVTEEDGPERKAQVDALTREGRTRYPARRQGAGGRGSAAPRRGGRGSAAPRRGGRGSAAPRQRIQRNRRKGMHYKLWTAAAENYAVMPATTQHWLLDTSDLAGGGGLRDAGPHD